MKHLSKAWSAAVVAGLAIAPSVALAQTNPFVTAGSLAANVGTSAGIASQKTLPQILGQIINIVLGFLGIVLLVYLLYAGFLWMTAGGDDAQVKKAKGMITNAIIGLIIIVAAFAISTFVLGSLVNVAQG